MRLAGIAGVLAMLVFALPASAGRDETAFEREVRSYLQANDRYLQLFAQPDDADLVHVTCGKAGRLDDLMCDIYVGEHGGGRFFMSRSGRSFDLKGCYYPYRSYDYFDESRYETDPCYDDITRR